MRPTKPPSKDEKVKRSLWICLLVLGIIGLFAATDFKEPILNLYGKAVVKGLEPQVIYNPGLRKLPQEAKTYEIWTILPHSGNMYHEEFDLFMKSDANVLMECSGMDTWHTGQNGSQALLPLYKRAYRVVIFDGGHHLPTMGLAPDIVVVPEWKGYVVHGYMRDAMPVNGLLQILKESQSPTIVVTVPRWRLVKERACMEEVCRLCLQKISPSIPSKPLTVQARPRISKMNSYLYSYVDRTYAEDPDELIRNCRSLQTGDVKRIYVAFDYKWISPSEIDAYLDNLQTALGIQAICVNEDHSVRTLLRPSL